MQTISTPAPPQMADIDTASDDYATRFKGPAGQWLLDVQETGTRQLLQKAGDIRSILDIGGGHAQLTHVFLEQDHTVTVAGSSLTCSTRLQPFLSKQCQYQAADLLHLPYTANAYELVTSFRLLTHCEDWQTLVAQLCRVSSRYVLVDYPTSQSINAIAPALFDAKKKVEKNTRYWRSFKHQEVDNAFIENGFVRMATYKQFFLPMALHRMLKCRPLSKVAEGFLRRIGLTARWGSPVIVLYQKRS